MEATVLAMNATQKITELFAARNTRKNGLKTIDFATRKSVNVAAKRRSVLQARKEKTIPVTVLGLSPVTQERVLAAGRFLMHVTFCIYICAYLSSKWVCRVIDQEENHGLEEQNTSALTPESMYCFGIWAACDLTGHCDSPWLMVPGISRSMVRWVQTLATLTLIGYMCAVLLDVASRLMLCVCLAFNRVVECTLAPAAVLHFLTLLYQTGEVKNRSISVHSLHDVASWGLALSVLSLVLAIISVCVMALFRLSPFAYRHRRFWRLPLELKPEPYLAAAFCTSLIGGACAGGVDIEAIVGSSDRSGEGDAGGGGGVRMTGEKKMQKKKNQEQLLLQPPLLPFPVVVAASSLTKPGQRPREGEGSDDGGENEGVAALLPLLVSSLREKVPQPASRSAARSTH